jgi:hypothetical protein
VGVDRFDPEVDEVEPMSSGECRLRGSSWHGRTRRQCAVRCRRTEVIYLDASKLPVTVPVQLMPAYVPLRRLPLMVAVACD